MADLVDQDPIERGPRDRDGGRLAQVGEQRHRDGLVQAEHLQRGGQQIVLERAVDAARQLEVAAVDRGRRRAAGGGVDLGRQLGVGQLVGDDRQAVVDQAWQSPGAEKQKLAALLKQKGLQHRHRLLLTVERAERLQPLAFRHDFFAMLRGWAENGSQEAWNRLRILVTVSTEPTLLESTDHSSFFAVANPIRLDDLDRNQLSLLAEQHRLRLVASDLEQLTSLLAGHPFLLRTALYEAMVGEVSIPQLLSAVDWSGGVFAQHLLHMRSWLQKSGHLPALCGILRGDGYVLATHDYAGLYSRGLVVEHARGRYRLRCRLYQDYFQAVCSAQAEGRGATSKGVGDPPSGSA